MVKELKRMWIMWIAIVIIYIIQAVTGIVVYINKNSLENRSKEHKEIINKMDTIINHVKR